MIDFDLFILHYPIHRGYDSCGIGVDGPSNDDSKIVLVKRKGDNDVLTRGIQGAFESGELDPHRQIRRHVGLAHTRYKVSYVYGSYCIRGWAFD